MMREKLYESTQAIGMSVCKEYSMGKRMNERRKIEIYVKMRYDKAKAQPTKT